MTTVYERTLTEIADALGRGYLSKALKISPSQREKLNQLFDGSMGLTNFGQPYAFDATWANWFQKRAIEADDTFEAFKANYLTMSNFATGKNGRRGRYLILPVQNPDSSMSDRSSHGGAYEEWYDGASETASETSSVSSGSDDRSSHYYGYNYAPRASSSASPHMVSRNNQTNPWGSSTSYIAQHQPQQQQQQQQHQHQHQHQQQQQQHLGSELVSEIEVSDSMDVVADPADTNRPRFDYSIPMPPPEFYCNLGETAYWSDEMSSPSQTFQSSSMNFHYDSWEQQQQQGSSYAFYDAETFNYDHGARDDDLWAL